MSNDGFDETSLARARDRFSPFFYETKGRFNDPNYPQFVSATFIGAGGSVLVKLGLPKDVPPVGPIMIGGAINP